MKRITDEQKAKHVPRYVKRLLGTSPRGGRLIGYEIRCSCGFSKKVNEPKRGAESDWKIHVREAVKMETKDAQRATPQNAPRVTNEDIEAAIRSEWYMNVGDAFRALPPDNFHPPVPASSPLNLITVCILVLDNGFTVTGESACVSPENFDAEIGKRVARENAINKVWPFLGFRLRDKVHAAHLNTP